AAVGGGGNYLMSLAYAAPELNQMFVRRLRTLMDQYLGSAAATTGPLETRLLQLIDQIDPPGATYLTDADRDLQKWGYWTDGNGSQQFGGVLDAAMHDQGLRKQAFRILNANPTPPNPSSTADSSLGNTTFPFLRGRRTFLFTRSPSSNGLPVPSSQPASPLLTIEQIDFNPVSANQEEEFFVIRNGSSNSVDLSGWHLSGAVELTFHGGTIIPGYTNGTDNIGLLYVAKSPAAFRARATGASGGQFRLVVGPYSGSLSARGETVELRKPDGTLLKSQSWAPASTVTQNQLRVSELNYSPLPPTVSETGTIPGVSASDFEFIELVNTGLTTLDLGGAKFTKGIEITFPIGAMLAAGERVLLVSNEGAFEARYGLGHPIAGEYLGNLGDEGDTLQLLDGRGEEVLEFHFEPDWFPYATGLGRTLVTRATTPDWKDYGTPSNPLPAVWTLSGPAGGTPGLGDGEFSAQYEGWRFDYWSLEEGGAAGILTKPEDDPDGDGANNFAEYCFGGNPRTADLTSSSVATAVEVGGVFYPAIAFIRRHLALDVVWSVQESSDLSAWVPADILVSSQNVGNGLEQVVYRSNSAINGTARFLRVEATK
ncbi:MAG: lamin tail domain-containing protein, partial [Verrucomicrobiota bacterium]